VTVAILSVLSSSAKVEQSSSALGFPITTLRDWEQGRVRPDTSARAYLMVIAKEPEAVERALHAA
jgi:putative transcriptional regulator